MSWCIFMLSTNHLLFRFHCSIVIAVILCCRCCCFHVIRCVVERIKPKTISTEQIPIRRLLLFSKRKHVYTQSLALAVLICAQ